jgi:hypothetical protein
MCLKPTHRPCRSVASDASITILKLSEQVDFKICNLHRPTREMHTCDFDSTMHGHSLVSQRLYGDHGDTHKSFLNILFIMITIQQQCETPRLCQAKMIQLEFVLKQIMQRTSPRVSFEYSIRNDRNKAAV